MKLRVDLKESVRTPAGSFRYIEGDWDATNGIVWNGTCSLGPRGDKRALPPNSGIHLASRLWVQRLDVEAVPANDNGKKPQQKRELV